MKVECPLCGESMGVEEFLGLARHCYLDHTGRKHAIGRNDKFVGGIVCVCGQSFKGDVELARHLFELAVSDDLKGHFLIYMMSTMRGIE